MLKMILCSMLASGLWTGIFAYHQSVQAPNWLSEQQSKLSLEQALDKFLTSIETRRKNWNRTPAERGKVNGMTFVRSRWSGTDLTTEKKMRGFSYVTIDNGTLVQISSQDVEPHDKVALETAEAAALTFIKK